MAILSFWSYGLVVCGKGNAYVKEEIGFQGRGGICARWSSSASFGTMLCYLEKYVREPRHIESKLSEIAQLKLVTYQNEIVINEGHQKLVRSKLLPHSLQMNFREAMRKAASKVLRPLNIEGAGTIEFLVDKHRTFLLYEMNTRIQVEHPITEEVTILHLHQENKSKVRLRVTLSAREIIIPKLFADGMQE